MKIERTKLKLICFASIELAGTHIKRIIRFSFKALPDALKIFCD